MDVGTTGLVFLHVGIGLLAAPALLWAFLRAIRSAVPRWRRGVRVAALLALLACLVTGIGIIEAAALGEAAQPALLGGHIAAGVAGLGLAVLGLGERAAVPQMRLGRSRARSRAPQALVVVTLLLLGLIATSAALPEGKPGDSSYQPDEYYRTLTATNARQADNPLFPSGVTLKAVPGSQLRPASYCGSAGCHPGTYRTWLGSAHQTAWVSKTYEGVVGLYEQDTRGMLLDGGVMAVTRRRH